MRRTLTVVTLSLLLLCGGLARAESMRCGNRLVGVGDPSVQLRARCGAPDHIEVRDIVRTVGVSAPSVGVVGPGAANGARVVVSQPPVRQRVTQRETIEVWTYRGDGRSLARAITVRRGKVAKIATLGPLDLPKDPGCAKSMFDLGTRTGVVRLSCGAPVDRSSWEEEVELEINGALVGQVRVHERWTYSPGKGRFLRILNFVDGKLVSVKTGPRIN
ncbi:MAG: DUF2845 domain-containing protein [Myxococcota bacterium]